ncbi:MAG TPA: AraC family transcriptional regulator [Clostridia bacterium]|nr:AraC family transcriptional regulator [Clostridia bacterium]
MAEDLYAPFGIVFKESDHGPYEPLEHYHDGYEIDLIVRAKFDLFVRDENLAIGERDLVFIDEYDLHKLIYSAGHAHDLYVLNFKRSFIQPFLKAHGGASLLDELSGKPVSRVNLNPRQFDRVRALFDDLRSLHQGIGRLPEARREGLLRCALFMLLETVRALLPDVRESALDPKREQVRRIVHYLDENFGEDITLERLEAHFYLSRYHICHIFKEVTGFTPLFYLQHRRVIEAQRLLRGPQADLSAVCFQCGFRSTQQFYKIFKKLTRQTPRDYARAHRARSNWS